MKTELFTQIDGMAGGGGGGGGASRPRVMVLAATNYPWAVRCLGGAGLAGAVGSMACGWGSPGG